LCQLDELELWVAVLELIVPKPIPFNMGGVMNAMTKLLELWSVSPDVYGDI
jgi:uncharacterized membrane protein